MNALLKQSLLLAFLIFHIGVGANINVNSKELKDIESSEVSVDDNIELTEPKKKLKKRVRRLLKKADNYFESMWYARASEIYDKLLNEDINLINAEVLQKAGDAHYFNSNMKMAYKWYNLLYKMQENNLSEENLYKFTNVLKGTGRYDKAKRIIRLMADNGSSIANLDNDEELFAILKREKNVEIVNLNMNTKFSDFSPIYMNDGSLAFSSAREETLSEKKVYKWNNEPFLDLYTGELSEDDPSEIKSLRKLSKKVNSKYHDASMALSKDGNTMYFTRNNFNKKLKRGKKGINHLKLYKSIKEDGEWSDAQELSINSDDYSTGHPAISPDGSKLYFASDMPGGYGEEDIYVADISEDGSLVNARNLGEQVNSKQKELFPYVTNTNLYFSSNRLLGIGGLDVYSAEIQEDRYGHAHNIGAPINGINDDFSFIINEEDRTGYFASNRTGGKGGDDIYYFKNMQVPSSSGNSSIVGVVFEKLTGKIIADAKVQLFDNDNVLMVEAYTDSFGNFEFAGLNQNQTYIIRAEKEQYKEKYLTIETKDLEEVSANVLMEKTGDGEAFVEDVAGIRYGDQSDDEFENTDAYASSGNNNDANTYNDDIAASDDSNDDYYSSETSSSSKGNYTGEFEAKPIYFDYDKYDLRENAKSELYFLAQELKNDGNLIVSIEGHADSRGSRDYNQWLSEERANSAKEYLLELGVDPVQINDTIGYGEDSLVNDCYDGVPCSIFKHQQNRRVEFILSERSI